MKLYYSPGACSQAPHIVLRETGLDFDLDKVDMRTRTVENGDSYSEINPKSYVPAIELDNGELLTEVPALLQYIADQNPDADIVPAAGTDDRYRVQEWLSYVGSELHKQFGPLVIPGMPEEAKAKATAQIERRLSLAREHLAEHDYLVGDKFSIADVYLFVILRWTAMFHMDCGAWPEFEAYRGRIEERPAVREAIEAEGLPV